jgi:hypothetical protein
VGYTAKIYGCLNGGLPGGAAPLGAEEEFVYVILVAVAAARVSYGHGPNDDCAKSNAMC